MQNLMWMYLYLKGNNLFFAYTRHSVFECFAWWIIAVINFYKNVQENSQAIFKPENFTT